MDRPAMIACISVFAATLAGACGGGDDGDRFPPSGGDGGAAGGCDLSDWTWSGEVLVDPSTCLGWSPRLDDLTWHEAVSPPEAEAGGCGATCDAEPEANACASLAAVDGYGDWRLPDLDELGALAAAAPPYDEAELAGDLWTATTHEGMDALAWTVDLSQPGREVALDKSSAAAARCVGSAAR